MHRKTEIQKLNNKHSYYAIEYGDMDGGLSGGGGTLMRPGDKYMSLPITGTAVAGPGTGLLPPPPRIIVGSLPKACDCSYAPYTMTSLKRGGGGGGGEGPRKAMTSLDVSTALRGDSDMSSIGLKPFTGTLKKPRSRHQHDYELPS